MATPTQRYLERTGRFFPRPAAEREPLPLADAGASAHRRGIVDALVASADSAARALRWRSIALPQLARAAGERAAGNADAAASLRSATIVSRRGSSRSIPTRISAQRRRATCCRARRRRGSSCSPGSLPLVTMEPFARVPGRDGLSRGQHPQSARTGDWSYSSSRTARELAGTLAWYYEHDGMMPMLIGHSQGGMLAMRTLHELAGAFGATIPVWNPAHRRTLPRADDRRPRRPATSGRSSACKVPYAAAIATGKLPRLLLGPVVDAPQAARDSGHRRRFHRLLDRVGSDRRRRSRAPNPYAASGTAHVRNVTLPASYSHIGLPRTLAPRREPVTRAWIDAYAPGSPGHCRRTTRGSTRPTSCTPPTSGIQRQEALVPRGAAAARSRMTRIGRRERQTRQP